MRNLFVVMCCMFIMSSLCSAQSPNRSMDSKAKVGIFIYSEPIKEIGQLIKDQKKTDTITRLEKVTDNEEFEKLIDVKVYKKLSNYNYQYIELEDLKYSIADYCDRKNLKDISNFNRDNILEFAQEQKMNYIIWVILGGKMESKYNFWSGININGSLIANIKAYDVSNNKAVYFEQVTSIGNARTPYRVIKDALPSLLDQISLKCNKIDFDDIAKKPATEIR